MGKLDLEPLDLDILEIEFTTCNYIKHTVCFLRGRKFSCGERLKKF